MNIVRKFKNVIRRIRLLNNWYRFMFPFDRIGQWPRKAILRSGAEIEIRAFRSTDFAILNEILIDDVYAIDSYRNPQKIVDIGANIGIYSLIVAKKFPKAKIVAVEPSKKNLEIFKNNIDSSKARNIEVVEKAVSSNEGFASLTLDENNSGAHSLLRIDKKNSETVQTTTISKLLPADILKIDAEGAEYEIFSGNIPDCKIIVMETHPYGDENKLLQKLSEKYIINSKGPIHVLTHK